MESAGTAADGVRQTPRATAWVLVVAVAAAAGLVHARSISGDFVMVDDPEYVFANPVVRAGLSADSLPYAFSLDARSTYFHPLTWLSLMLDVQLFGVAPWAFHLENVTLHAIVAALLAILLGRISGSRLAGCVGALVFAVHPLTVESVAWVTERKTLLSTALGLGAILSYLRFVDRGGRWRYAASVGLHALGMLAKPGLVLLPAVLLALDAWPLRRLGRRAGDAAPRDRASHVLLEKLPFVAVSAAIVVLGMLSARSFVPHHQDASMLVQRSLTAVALVPEYLSAVAWPVNLIVYRAYPRGVDAVAVAVGASVLLGITVAAALAFRRHPWVLVGWTWFLVTLAPYLGLHQTGLWPAWADRFAYVPLMGIVLVLTVGGGRVLESVAPRWRWSIAGAAAAAVGALVAATWVQQGYWKDSVTLFGRAVAVEPDSAASQFRLGLALLNAGRPAEGRGPLEKAIQLSPMNADAHFHLGRLAQAEGRISEAEQRFAAAIRIRPTHGPALFSYAALLATAGFPDAARPYFARFLEVAPAGWAAERAAAEEALRRSP